MGKLRLFTIMGEFKLDGHQHVTRGIHQHLTRHGGYGYQASWGCAFKVLQLLEAAFATKS